MKKTICNNIWILILIGYFIVGCQTTKNNKAPDVILTEYISNNTDKYFDDDPSIIIRDKHITVKRIWDDESKTYYFLSRIKNKDEDGNLLKLRLEPSAVDSGETIPQFVDRIGKPIIATNASTVRSNKPPWPKVSSGVLIVNGRIIEDKKTKNFILGIKANNELVAYPPGTTASQIIKDGTMDAVTAFTPIIQNYKPISNSIIKTVRNQLESHPRQVIAQYQNNDLLFLNCGGRGYDGEGMTISDVIRILQNLDGRIRFAYNLDGGGSTTTLIYGEQITPMIDKKGTENRTRANCLYIEQNIKNN